MDNIVNIEDYKSHEIAVCIVWIVGFEQSEWLAKWECPKCGKIDGIIYTGQPLQ